MEDNRKFRDERKSQAKTLEGGKKKESLLMGLFPDRETERRESHYDTGAETWLSLSLGPGQRFCVTRNTIVCNCLM